MYPPMGGMPPTPQPPQQPPVNTGPSPSFMQRLGGGLNMAAQNFGDPMSQGIARQTGQMLPQNRKKKQGNQLPVNGPPGMKPATSIMQTGNAAPNPYNMGGTSSPSMYSTMGGSSVPAMNSGLGFWNNYNQNRPMMY